MYTDKCSAYVSEESFLRYVSYVINNALKAYEDLTILIDCGKYRVCFDHSGPFNLKKKKKSDVHIFTDNIEEITNLCKKLQVKFSVEEDDAEKYKFPISYQVNVIGKMIILRSDFSRILALVDQMITSLRRAEEGRIYTKLLNNSAGEARIEEIIQSELFVSVKKDITEKLNDKLKEECYKDRDNYTFEFGVDDTLMIFFDSYKIYFEDIGYNKLTDNKTIASLWIAFLRYFVSFFSSHELCESFYWKEGSNYNGYYIFQFIITLKKLKNKPGKPGLKTL